MNTVQSKTVLKGYFEVGDKPTQSQFSDLITSTVCNTPNATGGDTAEDVQIIAGNADNVGNGGSVVISAGNATGSGTDGAVSLTHPTGASITISTDGRIRIASPFGVTIVNTTTGDSANY